MTSTRSDRNCAARPRWSGAPTSLSSRAQVRMVNGVARAVSMIRSASSEHTTPVATARARVWRMFTSASTKTG
ncbi:Uncharacterised protein [Mycobacterium tuberculosis]|uniref:Uncharacterized protein n=2 Tax=Mycobacterium tuberculosis TaxID=1773 RepID=A0A916LEH8_MYCTX|nr:Uncharacterised protein [Mycobacterium tuberculosis]